MGRLMPAAQFTSKGKIQMEELYQVLQKAVEIGASDVFAVAGAPLTYKINGRQQRSGDPLRPEDTQQLVQALYSQAGRDNGAHLSHNAVDDDFSLTVPNLGRFRANILRQRGSLAAVLRVIQFGLPSAEALHIPPQVMAYAQRRKGLVLVTGAAGSGKSTTLACLIDAINHRREGHIITMEDPIEFIHRHDKCLVTQREIGSDTVGYVQALRGALRESPDVILLGEMRDDETMEVAMQAAETGQLLFSTLHTTGAANSVDRIIDAFPAGRQGQVRIQLSMVLQGVISQQLVPTTDGGQTVAFEVMNATPAIKTLIREGRTHQIDATLQAAAGQGMLTMDDSLLALYRAGKITRETVEISCLHPETVKRKLMQ